MGPEEKNLDSDPEIKKKPGLLQFLLYLTVDHAGDVRS